MHQEPVLVTGDPKAISYVCANDDLFPRNEATKQVLQTVFPNSVFVQEGEEHRRQKKLVSGAFTYETRFEKMFTRKSSTLLSPPAVQELSDILYDLANQMVDQWKGELETSTDAEYIVNVQKSIQVLATDAISRSALAYSIKDSKGPVKDLLARLGDLEDNQLTVFLQLVLNKIPWLSKLPNPVTLRWFRFRAELGYIADDVWEKGVLNHAFHSRLLEAIGQDQRDIAIGQITAILFAGSETTANIIVETVHKLTVYPHIQDKLRKELTEFVKKQGMPIPYADLINPTALPYLDAVMKEALRCLASVPHLQRRAGVRTDIPLEFPIRLSNGKVVQEIHVEPGQDIFMPVRDGINTSPELWGPESKKFIPERWLDGTIPKIVETIQVPGHILTFGDGPKYCLGRAFAFAEFKIFLSTMLLNFEFLTPQSEDINKIIFHLSGPAVKPTVKGREKEGPALPLAIKLLS
ncbi:hypothetical protein CVT25_015351 [Psilocybe cyanescens]|uniref:Cytochrome P450 n=1 Tax=Psilocybe cyanescens TaxID=93625 RepID=A0A409WH77_PSICY|nr:hypothetical protein CVT25_015351 [Psilocybe cyanescens]